MSEAKIDYSKKYDYVSTLKGIEGNNWTWIELKAFELKSQKSFALATNGTSIEKGDQLGVYRFLIDFDNITETIAHDWGEYDSMAGRLAQKYADVGKTLQDANSGIEAIKGAVTPGNIDSKLANSLYGVKNNEVASYKVDSSFVYQGTRRRNYSFTFQIAYQGNRKNGGYVTNRFKEVVEPIRRLEYLSCAETTSNGVSIQFPAVFEISSVPNSFINIKNAALMSVQPQWSGPWVDGYPSKCEFTLDIEEIDPLYKNSFTGTWPALEIGEKGEKM